MNGQKQAPPPVRSLSVLRSREGLNSFYNNNRANFSGEKIAMKLSWVYLF